MKRIEFASAWCRACKRPERRVGSTECAQCLGRLHPVLLVDVELGDSVQLGPFVHLYGCSLGAETRVGAFTEIASGAVVGARCKIGSHSFLCDGVTLGEGVFVGHGVLFCNDRHPRAVRKDGEPCGPEDWTLEPVEVGSGVSIGTGAVLLPGIRLGERCVVGAGAVVTRDVLAGETVKGNPARVHARGPR